MDDDNADDNNDNNNNDPTFPWVVPRLRRWEFTSDSTRYQRLQAAPSDHDLVVMWALWVVITSLIALYVGSIVWAIVRTKSSLSKRICIWLIFLMYSFPRLVPCRVPSTPSRGLIGARQCVNGNLFTWSLGLPEMHGST